VMVMTSYDDNVPDEKKHKGKRPKSKAKFLKMKILNDFTKDEASRIVKDNVSEEAEVKTDGSTSYNDFKKIVKNHEKHVVKAKDVASLLPWVHIAISNIKRQ